MDYSQVLATLFPISRTLPPATAGGRVREKHMSQFLIQVLEKTTTTTTGTPVHCLLSDDPTLSTTREVTGAFPVVTLDIPSGNATEQVIDLLRQSAEDIPPEVAIRPYACSPAEFIHAVTRTDIPPTRRPHYDLIWIPYQGVDPSSLLLPPAMAGGRSTLLCLEDISQSHALLLPTSFMQHGYYCVPIGLASAPVAHTCLFLVKPMAEMDWEQDKAVSGQVQEVYDRIFGKGKQEEEESDESSSPSPSPSSISPAVAGEMEEGDPHQAFLRKLRDACDPSAPRNPKVTAFLKKGMSIRYQRVIEGKKLREIANSSHGSIWCYDAASKLLMGPDGMHKLRYLQNYSVLQEMLNRNHNYPYVSKHADRQWWSDPEGYLGACTEKIVHRTGKPILWPSDAWLFGQEEEEEENPTEEVPPPPPPPAPKEQEEGEGEEGRSLLARLRKACSVSPAPIPDSAGMGAGGDLPAQLDWAFTSIPPHLRWGYATDVVTQLKKGWYIMTQNKVYGVNMNDIAIKMGSTLKVARQSIYVLQPRDLARLIMGPKGLHKLRYLRDMNLLMELMQPRNYKYVQKHADRDWWQEEDYADRTITIRKSKRNTLQWPTLEWMLGSPSPAPAGAGDGANSCIAPVERDHPCGDPTPGDFCPQHEPLCFHAYFPLRNNNTVVPCIAVRDSQEPFVYFPAYPYGDDDSYLPNDTYPADVDLDSLPLRIPERPPHWDPQAGTPVLIEQDDELTYTQARITKVHPTEEEVVYDVEWHDENQQPHKELLALDQMWPAFPSQ